MSLWDLLAETATFEARWRSVHDEATRRAWRKHWQIWVTCPGYLGEVKPGDLERCTATVLSQEVYDDDFRELLFRGACLGCGWVDARARASENEAAEDAVSHAHPGWEFLPAVAAMPMHDSQSQREKATEAWLAKVRPLLPAGWLEAGGPIRTVRGEHATRHVPARTPFAGYDMACTEAEAGPLTLF
jgi:hypothetical protein